MQASFIVSDLNDIRKYLLMDFMVYLANHPVDQDHHGQAIADLITKAFNRAIADTRPRPAQATETTLIENITLFKTMLTRDLLSYMTSRGSNLETVTLQSCQAEIEKIIEHIYDICIPTTRQAPVETKSSKQVDAKDLILLAKTWPKLDEALKAVLAQLVGAPALVDNSNAVGFLTNWMVTTESDQYPLFLEVLHEIHQQGEQNNKSGTLGICQYRRHAANGKISVCDHNALFVEEKDVGDVKAGYKTCQKHHERLAKESSTSRTKPVNQIPIKIYPSSHLTPVEVDKEEINRQCQIAIGENLLDLKQCSGISHCSVSDGEGFLVPVCHDHLLSYKPRDLVFTENAFEFKELPVTQQTFCCQVQFGNYHTCDKLALYKNGYGAHLCKDHRFWTSMNDDLVKMMVPINAELKLFAEKIKDKITEKEPKCKMYINKHERCQIAIGNDLLRLEQCKCDATQKFNDVWVCQDHLNQIKIYNPRYVDTEKYDINYKTSVKLFKTGLMTYNSFDANNFKCDVKHVSNDTTGCRYDAMCENVYGAKLCLQHQAFICKGQFEELKVPRDPKVPEVINDYEIEEKKSHCQIAVGVNLLDLKACQNKVHGPINNGKGPLVCWEHKCLIHSENPLLDREKGHPICELTPLTTVKLKVPDEQLRNFTGILEKQLQCQVINRESGPCCRQAASETVYGALLCDFHRVAVAEGKANYLTVPRDAKRIPYIAEKPKEAKLTLTESSHDDEESYCGNYNDSGEQCGNKAVYHCGNGSDICEMHYQQYYGTPQEVKPKEEQLCSYVDTVTGEQCTHSRSGQGRSPIAASLCREHRESYKPIPTEKKLSAEQAKEKLGYPVCGAELLNGRGTCSLRVAKDSDRCSVHASTIKSSK